MGQRSVDWGVRGDSVCCHRENENIARVCSIALHFRHEDLVKIKLFIIKVCEKSKGKASNSIE